MPFILIIAITVIGFCFGCKIGAIFGPSAYSFVLMFVNNTIKKLLALLTNSVKTVVKWYDIVS